MTFSAAASPPHRVVVVISAPGDPRAARQRALLEDGAPGLRERDVIIEAMTPAAARRDRPDLGARADADFEVLLVGRDGGVKMRRHEPVAASEICALIDTMPMRREEMRSRRS